MSKLLNHTINLILADDDNDDCLLFKEALEEIPISVKLNTVHDGEQLIHVLDNLISDKSNSSEFPDVIFLDLNMPRKNGFTALIEIKSNELLKHIPVVIFSTSYDSVIANLLYQNGAHYYICKPSDFTQFIKVIHHAINLTTTNNTKPLYTQPSIENYLLSNSHRVLF